MNVLILNKDEDTTGTIIMMDIRTGTRGIYTSDSFPYPIVKVGNFPYSYPFNVRFLIKT